MSTIGLYQENPVTDTSILAPIFLIFLFFLPMSAYYLYLRFIEQRDKMIIDDNEHEIGDEIDYKLHGNVLSYKLMIRKVSDTDWEAYKLFRSGRGISLRKGNLSEIIGYMNRNFGYNDEVSLSVHHSTEGINNA